MNRNGRSGVRGETRALSLEKERRVLTSERGTFKAIRDKEISNVRNRKAMPTPILQSQTWPDPGGLQLIAENLPL